MTPNVIVVLFIHGTVVFMYCGLLMYRMWNLTHKESQMEERKMKPRGCKPKDTSSSGMFTVRTLVAEQKAIIRYARNVRGVSANQFILDSIRSQMPAQWIEQAGENRPLICSKCGFLSGSQAESADDHQFRCWGAQSAATSEANLDYLRSAPANDGESNQSAN